MSQKITSYHLNRLAVVYQRVSSDYQVKNSKGSLQWQQSMAQQALDYGWDHGNIQDIDEDLGISALSGQFRPGMDRLMDLVAAGDVGAIFVTEHTRAGRQASEFAKLLELCMRNGTLFITNASVYDLSIKSDRLTLGLLIEVAKAEIDTMRERAVESIRALLKVGKLRIPSPTGYILDDDGQFIIDPKVRDEIEYIFQVFRETLSVRGTVKRLHEEGFKLTVKKLWKNRYYQTEPNYTRIHSILINPAYAGVYAYGKTVTTWRTPNKDTLKKHVRRERNPEKWEACIKNHHKPYITFDEFIQNQETIERNCRRSAKGRSVVASGPALLQGLVWCGRCGQRLDTVYQQGKSQLAISYRCRGDNHKRAGRMCQSIPGNQLDAEVKAALIEALSPVRVGNVLSLARDANYQAQQYRRLWEKKLADAQRVVTVADAMARAAISQEAESLSAQRLMRELATAEVELETLRHQINLDRKPVPSQTDEMMISELSRNIGLLWEHPTTTVAQRKQIIRELLQSIKLTRNEDKVTAILTWSSEAKSILQFHANINRISKTPEETLQRIRDLNKTHNKAEIAEILNSEGFKTQRGLNFTNHTVDSVRRMHGIKAPRGKESKSILQRRFTPSVIEKIRELSLTHDNAEIASTLVCEGYASPRGGILNTTSVRRLRIRHNINIDLYIRHPPRTSRKALEIIRNLSPYQRDSQIADRLNEMDIKTSRGKKWTEIIVYTIRRKHIVKNASEQH